MTPLARRIAFAAAVLAAATAGTVVGLVAWPAEAMRDALRYRSR